MNIVEYEKQFQEILNGDNTKPPYDSEDYINYVKLNQSRVNRWTKKGLINEELQSLIQKIDQPLNWILITEPWCGDAAHIHPFIAKMASLNSKINLTIQNRDATNSEIDNYLTNGSKSIPKLIVRDKEGNDLFDWGPRPAEAQAMVLAFKNDTVKSNEEKKIELQKWYNKDKGQSTQKELYELINQL